MHVLKICTRYIHNQTYLTKFPVLLNPLLPLSRILDNLKFCNDPLNFEITRSTVPI